MKQLSLLGAAVAMLAVACGSDDGSAGASLARADLPRAAAAPDDAVAAVASVNGVGTDLYRWLATTQPGGNIVLSPASIATALAMARAGAAGATAAEMDRVLHVDDAVALHPSMNALDQALASRSGPQPVGDGTTVDVTLTSANSLWAQRGLTYQQPFLDTLASQYGAGVRLVDFAPKPEPARRAINGWVAEQTKDRIPELLAEGTIDDLTRLVLVNAVYLKAPWANPFEPAATEPATFTRADGSTATVPFMATREPLPYAEGPGWRAVELAYAGGGLALLVVVPDAGTLAAFEQGFDAARLADVAAALASTVVVLRLPKWGADTAISLRDALAELGMPTAFGEAADFSAMTTDEPLYVDDVVHQANITVDENGTEAAAATAVIAAATGLPVGAPLELTVDRPFLYALRDLATGAVLFLGRVDDPTAG